MERKREIYIKLEHIKELVTIMKEIKSKEEYLQELFNHYDKLSVEETKIFESWGSNIEDTMHRLNHITL